MARSMVYRTCGGFGDSIGHLRLISGMSRFFPDHKHIVVYEEPSDGRSELVPVFNAARFIDGFIKVPPDLRSPLTSPLNQSVVDMLHDMMDIEFLYDFQAPPFPPIPILDVQPGWLPCPDLPILSSDDFSWPLHHQIPEGSIMIQSSSMSYKGESAMMRGVGRLIDMIEDEFSIPVILIGGPRDAQLVDETPKLGMNMVGKIPLITSLRGICESVGVISVESWSAIAAGAFKLPCLMISHEEDIWQNAILFRDNYDISKILHPSYLENPEGIFDIFRDMLNTT